MESKNLRKNARKASLFMALLAHPTRLQILCLLFEEPREVGAIREYLKLSQPLVSHHLALLRRHRIVACNRVGKLMVYKISHELVEPMMKVLHGHFCVDGLAK